MNEHEIEENLLAGRRSFKRHAIKFAGTYTPLEDLLQEAAIAQWLSLKDGHSTELSAWRARLGVTRAGMRHLWTGQETNSGTGKDVMRIRMVFTYLDALDYDYFGTTDNLDPILARVDLMDTLRELTPRQKEVVLRKFWLEETFPEIAEAMGLSKKQAESTWYKTVQPLLRERLAHLAVDAAA